MISVIPKDWKPSIRERVVAHIQQLLRELPCEVEGHEADKLFRSIGRGDPDELAEINVNSSPAAYVEDGEEERVGEWSCQHISKELMVYIHFRFPKGQQGVEPYTVFNYYLTRVQQAIFADTKLGGNCSDVNERGSSPQIFPSDGLLGGSLVLVIKYRHPQSDPTTLR